MESELDNETMQLLQQVQAGRTGAFERLFDRHRDYLVRLVALRLDGRVRSRVDPADVVQETYVEALRRFDAYLQNPALPFRLWLRQIACDQALKARRHHRQAARRTVDRELALPQRSSALLARQLYGNVATPSEHLKQAEASGRLRDAIDRLPDHERDVVVMRHYEELSNQEISTLLQITPAAVSKRHGRALLRLHELLYGSQDED
jgi:RNA polymerase sigma-70 factor (ECF subfamily)